MRIWLIIVTCGLIGLSVASASDRHDAIRWDDLMPEGEQAPLPLFGHTGGAFDIDTPPQSQDFRINLALSGRAVRLEGFVVPLDLVGDKVRRFLLVPYFGACIHLPPPPPNQIVDVTLSEPRRVGDGARPVTIRGTIWAQQSATALASVAYVMRDASLD